MPALNLRQQITQIRQGIPVAKGRTDGQILALSLDQIQSAVDAQSSAIQDIEVKLSFPNNTVRIINGSRTPASSAAPGVDGEICWDATGVLYIHMGGVWWKLVGASF